MSPDDPRHGTYAGYQAHHKVSQKPCLACIAAKGRYRKKSELEQMRGIERQVSALGSYRRLTALIASGWSYHQIAEQMGCGPAWPREIVIRGESALLRRTTVARVSQAYERLADRIPAADTPRGKQWISRNQWAAQKRGWATVEAWLGVDIDDPDAQPDPGWQDWGNRKPQAVTLEDFDWLVSCGESPEQAAARLGVTLNTISDYRLRLARQEVA